MGPFGKLVVIRSYVFVANLKALRQRLNVGRVLGQLVLDLVYGVLRWHEDLLSLSRWTLHQLVSLGNYELLFIIQSWSTRLHTSIENLVLATTHILAHCTSAHLLRIQIFETLYLINFKGVCALSAWAIRGADTLLLLLHVEVEIRVLNVAHIGRLLMTAEQVTPVSLLADGASAIATYLAPFGLGICARQRYVQVTSRQIPIFHFRIIVFGIS